MDYLHLQRGIGYSYYRCRLQPLDDALLVARTGWRLFKASSPAESPKRLLTHEHVTCTLVARVMHHSSRRRRPDRQRDTQDSRRVLLQTRNSTRPGGTPSGSAAAMGCPRSIRSPLEPCGSLPSIAKNERITRKKDTRVGDKDR